MKLSFSPLLFFSSVHLVSIFEFGTSTPEDSVAASLSGLEEKIDTFQNSVDDKPNLDAYIPFATEVFSDWVQIHKAVDRLPYSSTKGKFQEQLNALPEKADQATLQLGIKIGEGFEGLLSKLRKFISTLKGALLDHLKRVNRANKVAEIVAQLPALISEMLAFMESIGIKLIDAALVKQIRASANALIENDNRLVDELVNLQKRIEEVNQRMANFWDHWQQKYEKKLQDEKEESDYHWE